MKKLFVLFALMAITSLNRVGATEEGTVQLGYFYGWTIGVPGAYYKNINVSVSQEGTFTKSGSFGNFNLYQHFFYVGQTVGNWIVNFNQLELIYDGVVCYTTTSNAETYSVLFLPDWQYRITYTVTDNNP